MFQLAEVGGAVRDRFLGHFSDDVDFVAIPPQDVMALGIDDAFDLLIGFIVQQGFSIKQIKPEFQTIRATVPDGHPLRSRTTGVDFVLARRDGPSSDGRRPDFVVPGTLFDDLQRRDFTVNAIAILDGDVIDPFGGRNDIDNNLLRFVGNPQQRIQEDSLRVLRFFRFLVTKQFDPDPASLAACLQPESAEMLRTLPIDRVFTEFKKMFAGDTVRAIQVLSTFPDHLNDAIFRDGFHLVPSLSKR